MLNQFGVAEIEDAIADELHSLCMDDAVDRRRMAAWIHDLIVETEKRGRGCSQPCGGDRKTVPVPPMSDAELLRSPRKPVPVTFKRASRVLVANRTKPVVSRGMLIDQVTGEKYRDPRSTGKRGGK